jgi:hypothetical protein
VTAGTATAKRTRVYRCDICGRVLKGEHWVYSQARKVRYCHPNDWDSCEARSLAQEAKP